MKDELYIYSSAGEQVERLAADFVGTINISAKREHSWFFATITGFTTPGTIQMYDFKASEGNRWSVYRKTKVNGLILEDFAAEQVRTCVCVILRVHTAVQIWYSSKDGTKVPMFIVRHKDTLVDGTAPAIQYGLYAVTRNNLRFTRSRLGYGGFSIAISPSFSSSILTAMKAYGFIYAVPNIRLVNWLYS